ncbi:MAG: Ig-like domain-containing protein [Rhizobiaceae bacterium]
MSAPWRGANGEGHETLPSFALYDEHGASNSGSQFPFGAGNTISAEGSSSILLDRDLLLNGDYSRISSDLHIQGADGQSLTITGFFTTSTPPVLVSQEGAMILPATAGLLAGPETPGAYAQAGNIQTGDPIGQVALLDGEASVQRADGTTEPLALGSPLFEDDVVSTGADGKLSLKFIDGTALTMSESARMVMDELVYDPAATDNSMVMNLVQGTFVFVTGQIAKTGSVRADTPVATMGIRGTTPVVTIESATQATVFGIAPDPDGTVGSYQIINLVTGQVLGTVSSTAFVYRLANANGSLQQIDLNPTTIGNTGELLNNTYGVFGSQGGNQGGNGNDPEENQDGDGSNPPPDQRGLLDDPGFGLNGFQIAGFHIDPLGDPTLPGFAGPGAPPPGGPFFNMDPNQPSGILVPNDPLTNTPTAFSLSIANFPLDEDTGTTLNGFAINYPNPLIVSMVAGSTVTLASTAGLTFTIGDGVDDEIMSFTGSAAAVQAALNGAIYTPTPDSTHGSLEIVFIDSTNLVQVGFISVPISINPVPDPTIANDDLFFDVPEDAGTDGNPVFTANLFADNGFGIDSDPDVDAIRVTRFRVDTDDDNDYTDEFWIDVPEGGSAQYEENGGFVTVYSDGTIELIPGPDWNHLAQGVSGFLGSAQYEITDGQGNFATAVASAFVTGENDTPVAPDGEMITNPYTAVHGTLEVTDPDDGDVITYSLVTGPQHGTIAIEADGSFVYTPDGSFVGEDSFVYQATDSANATVVQTMPITIEQNGIYHVENYTIDGQQVELLFESISQTTSNWGNFTLQVNLTDPLEPDVNVSFVFDESGSMGTIEYALQMEAIQQTINDLRLQFLDSASQVDIQMVQYDSGVNSGVYDLFDPLLNDVAALYPFDGGGTIYSGALQAVLDFLNEPEQSGETNYVIFTSDGVPGDNETQWGPIATSIQALATISAFGIGTGANLVTLSAIDSDANATPVVTSSDLADAFSATPVFGLELVNYSVTVSPDGGEGSDFTDNFYYSQNGLNYTFDGYINELNNELGSQNIITFSLTFDTDGDEFTTEDQQTVTISNTIAGAENDYVIIGSAGNDFLAGGSQNDQINGNAGNDTLIGGAGEDSLYGDEGDDLIIGGAGADTMGGGPGKDTFILDSLDFGDSEGGDYIEDFSIDDDVLDISGLIEGTYSGNPLDYVDAYFNGSASYFSVNIMIDADGTGTEADFQDAVYADFSEPISETVLNIVFEAGQDPVAVQFVSSAPI